MRGMLNKQDNNVLNSGEIGIQYRSVKIGIDNRVFGLI